MGVQKYRLDVILDLVFFIKYYSSNNILIFIHQNYQKNYMLYIIEKQKSSI